MKKLIFFVYSLVIASVFADSYIVKGQQPTKLFSIRVDNMSGAERTMIGSLQGIIADNHSEQIYIRPLAGGYDTWLDDLVNNYNVERIEVVDAFYLLDYFKETLNGYILYQAGNHSINSATSLAGIERAVIIEQSIESEAVALSLPLIHDLRGIDEAFIHANYMNQLNPDVVIEQREEFEHTFRDYAILSRAFTFFDGNSDFRKQVLDGLNPNSVMMGWGDAWQGEDVFIRAGSERGVFTIPSDHTHNLSPLSGFPSIQQTQQSPPPIMADSNTHYVSFLFTDGDNLQWTLGNLQSDNRWFASPNRGNFDMGWGLPPSLVHAAPTVMKWYYDNASTGPGYDGFIVGPSGGGYLYPSMYPRDELNLHVQELSEWMSLGDLSIIEILDFWSQTHTDIWDIYTAQDQIDGLIYLEYGDHAEPQGRTIWSNGKPVVAPRIKLWNGLPGSDPETIIERINSAPRDITSAAGYSMVIVGVWEHSLQEIQSIVDSFSSDVRVVTPNIFIELMTDNIPHGVNFNYDFTGADFQSSHMTLVGDAFWVSDYDSLFDPYPDRLRLTYNSDGLVGSAWANQTFDASQSWSTIYRFQISYPALGGADGLGFHIHGDGVGANPGHEGGNLSSPRFSAVVDTWNNGEGADESLRLILNGDQVYINNLLDYDDDPNPGSSPTVFRMELSYVAGNNEISIRLYDEGSSDTLFDSALNINLDNFGPSWVGFSAVTGMSTQNHDIRTWMLTGSIAFLGDVNEDGNINVVDIVSMVNIILGLSPYTDLADINGDQQVDVLDVIELVNIIIDF